MGWFEPEGLGTFISGLAAIISAFYASRAAKEVKPNHGSSLKDIVNLIDDKVDSLAHQLGEVKKDASVTHEDILHRLRHIERSISKRDKPRN